MFFKWLYNEEVFHFNSYHLLFILFVKHRVPDLTEVKKKKKKGRELSIVFKQWFKLCEWHTLENTAFWEAAVWYS